MADVNIQTYSKDDVVTHYERAEGLMPPERVLFAKYVKPGMEILDIGVGGGRTTPFLAKDAKRYLGLDYAQGMVDACKRRFPEHDFAWGDATNLSDIGDESFDLTIFSFNGLDSIPSDEGRIQALKEMRRVTRADGRIIISSHNARQLILLPNLEGASIVQTGWRTLRAAWKSLSIARRNLATGVFGKGHGYIADPVHGGLFNHSSTPESIARDAVAAGLDVVESVGAFAPRRVPRICNNWETYVLKRSGA